MPDKAYDKKLKNILLLKSCGIEAENPLKVCVLASAADLQRIARNKVEIFSEDDSPKEFKNHLNF